MASSTQQVPTQIANLALAHCGVSKPIVLLSTERSLDAQMCRTMYDLARQATLSDYRWMFATKQVTPSLVASYPTPEWLYAYQYPADALQITRFMSWRLKNDTRQSRIPYTLMQPVSNTLSQLSPQPAAYSQTTGLWIYTDWPGTNTSLPTIIEYVFDNKDVSQWTADFIMAMSYKLAELIVVTLTSGDPMGMQAKILANYQSAVDRAKVKNANEEQRPEDPEAEWIRSRQGEAFSMPGMNWIAEPSGFTVL